MQTDVASRSTEPIALVPLTLVAADGFRLAPRSDVASAPVLRSYEHAAPNGALAR